MELGGHLSASAALTLGEKSPGALSKGGWVGPKACLAVLKKMNFVAFAKN
jgi:hypothetical protein